MYIRGLNLVVLLHHCINSYNAVHSARLWALHVDSKTLLAIKGLIHVHSYSRLSRIILQIESKLGDVVLCLYARLRMFRLAYINVYMGYSINVIGIIKTDIEAGGVYRMYIQ